eukprot:gene4767-5829_t
MFKGKGGSDAKGLSAEDAEVEEEELPFPEDLLDGWASTDDYCDNANAFLFHWPAKAAEATILPKAKLVNLEPLLAAPDDFVTNINVLCHEHAT